MFARLHWWRIYYKTLDKRSKQKWTSAIVLEMITSDESEWLEEYDGTSSKVITNKAIPWRSDKVTEFCHWLNENNRPKVSQRSKDMTLTRCVGTPSDWPKPSHLSKCSWLFKWLLHIWLKDRYENVSSPISGTYNCMTDPYYYGKYMYDHVSFLTSLAFVSDSNSYEGLRQLLNQCHPKSVQYFYD